MAASGLFTVQQFINRGVIKLAPDVLIYINGSFGKRILTPVASTDQSISFKDGITSLNIQNTIDPPGQSTATFQVATPIYGEGSNYWVPIDDTDTGRTYRVPILVPMMEVKIYLKGRFLSDGEPRYYPSFWGLISAVEENYSGGLYTLNVSCVDMLHWWHWSTVNVHPVAAESIAVGGDLELTAFATIFKESDPYTIIYRLTELMGTSLFVPPTWVGQLSDQKQSFPDVAISAVNNRIMKYWEERFKYSGSLLKMYGLSGREVTVTAKGKGKDRTYKLGQILPNGKKVQSTAVTVQELGRDISTSVYNEDNAFLNNMYLQGFPVFHEFDKMGTWETSEYMTKLEIATQIRDRVEYEFFQDVNGNFIFKPPFFNMNVKHTMPYVIKPNDIVNSSFQIEAEGIITSMEVKTPFHPALRSEQYPSGIGYHIDVDLASKYGIRHRTLQSQWIFTPQAANQLALGYMALINSKCTTGSLTLPGRPELRMGYPIYIDHRDSFHYVKGINHAFDFGGSFTTTLSLEAERVKRYDDKGNVQKDMVYHFLGTEALLEESAIVEKTWDQKGKKLASNKSYGVAQGRYEIVPRKSLTVTTGNNEETSAESFKAATSVSVPFTDEEGYKLIGGFRYGRDLPYNFERTMFVIDDVAGYERESATMGILHKQQKRVRSKDSYVDLSKSTVNANAQQVASSQAQTDTAMVAGATSQEASATGGTAGQSTAPNTKGGVNDSKWQYEGIILSYLDDYIIDNGDGSGEFGEKVEAEIREANTVVNPSIKETHKKSPKILAGQTKNTQVEVKTNIDYTPPGQDSLADAWSRAVEQTFRREPE